MKSLRQQIADTIVGETDTQPGFLVGYDIADGILAAIPFLQHIYDRYSCAVCGAAMSDLDVFLGELCVLCREDDERGTISHIGPPPPNPVGNAA